MTVFSPHLLRLFLFLTAHLNIPRLVFLLLAEKPLLLVGWNHLVRRQWLLPLLMFLLLMLLLLPMLHTSRLGLYGRLSLAGVRVQARSSSVRSQSLHIMVTAFARSGGTGCSSMPMAIAFQVGCILSCVSAVFLHTGQRESCAASSRKQCQWMAWPQGISCDAERELKRSSWQMGQFCMYLPTLQLCCAKREASMHIPQS